MIRGNIISGNQASGRGGAVYTNGGSGGPHLIDNIIASNSASIGGGCSWYGSGTGGVIRENFFYRNRANRGGAFDSDWCVSVSIRRNRFLENSDASGCVRYGAGSDPGVQWNSLVDDEPYEIVNNGLPYLPAQFNWFGCDSPATRCQGRVEYIPWLRSPLIFDIAAESITGPPDIVAAESTYVPKVVVRNRGHCDSFPDPDSVDVTFFTATCVIGHYRKYVRVERVVRQNSTVEVAFPAWTAPPDSGVECSMKVWLHYAPDMDSSNDTISKRILVSPPGGVKDGSTIRAFRFILACRPAVFRLFTELSYSLPEPGYARLEILDASGQVVVTLVAGVQQPGSGGLRWAGVDQEGVALPPGVYFARLQTGKFTATRKIVKTQ